jgi:hypothetical protein
MGCGAIEAVNDGSWLWEGRRILIVQGKDAKAGEEMETGEILC